MKRKVKYPEDPLEKPQRVSSVVSASIKDLHSSKILLVNTDTVPGLAVSPYLPKAVYALYALKGRAYHKPLVWMADDFNRLAPELVVEEYVEPLIKRYWPGAITLVFNVKPKTRTYEHLEYLEKEIYQGCTTSPTHNRSYSLGVRIPQGDETLLSLLKALEAPLAVTSVNRSGEEELIDLVTIKAKFKEKISYTLFGTEHQKKATPHTGKSVKPQTSTVVDARTPELRVLRKGAVVLADRKNNYCERSD